jgi:hypothetical protein
MLPLENNCIVVLDENNNIMQYKIPSGDLVKHIFLPFRARRIVVASSTSLVALAP